MLTRKEPPSLAENSQEAVTGSGLGKKKVLPFRLSDAWRRRGSGVGSRNRKMRTGIAFSLALAFVVMTVIALYADLPHMLVAFAQFRWQYLPLIVGFTLFNYFWRFLKWQYYLKRLRITALSWGKSLLIFLSGLSMAITPGKVGELLKSYQLKRATGEPISRTSPIIIAERLSDGLAMLILAAGGLALYRFGWEVLLVLLMVGLAGVLVIQNRELVMKLVGPGGLGERAPWIARFMPLLREFYESSYTLLQWRPLLLAVGIGVISWSGECVALYFVFTGLGVPGGFDLFLKAMFILAVSSLIGSATGLPGGLGTADGSMLGLTRLLVSASSTLGGAATLLIRLCTLWLGLLIGVGAVLIFRSIQQVEPPNGLPGSDAGQDQHHSGLLGSIPGRDTEEVGM